MNGISPVVVGRGMAGRAIRQSLVITSQMDPELTIFPVRTVERGEPLDGYVSDRNSNVLFLANPSALHAGSILEGAKAGFGAIAAEKPVCVHPDEIHMLRSMDIFVSVYHGYRVLWGPRTIKEMIVDGKLGDVFSIEARYWQSSSAQKAVEGGVHRDDWKNDPGLNGPRDTLTDLGSHVVDLFLYFMDEKPSNSLCRLFYRNAPARHRDTHVQILLDFQGGRQALASVSKTLHGAGNELECTVIGTKGAATWRFTNPDQVELGTGRLKTIIAREIVNASSGTAPFHGLGWLEGYVSITRHTLRHAAGLSSLPVPTLPEALKVMESILLADIKEIN